MVDLITAILGVILLYFGIPVVLSIIGFFLAIAVIIVIIAVMISRHLKNWRG